MCGSNISAFFTPIVQNCRRFCLLELIEPETSKIFGNLLLFLQIPPPKPPPPEMHFIPNPSNTEFIYLVGLEHVVDFLTKETKMPLPPQPFACSQCQSDFTPVWKWEISKKNKGKSSKKYCLIFSKLPHWF